MDDATSALDAATELQATANTSRSRWTKVIVAHRVSTIRKADLILAIDQSKVIQQKISEKLIKSPEGAFD